MTIFRLTLLRVSHWSTTGAQGTMLNSNKRNEEFAMLDPRDGTDPFRLLSPLIDKQLRMNLAIDTLFRKAKPKAPAMLICGQFVIAAAMLCITHVRNQIESCNSTSFRSARSLLARIDEPKRLVCNVRWYNSDVTSACIAKRTVPKCVVLF